MNFPEELLYSRSHEWVKKTAEGVYEVGISDYAQKTLGDLVFLSLPEAGEGVTAGEPACDLESVKAVSDVISPVTGVVSEVNEALVDEPEKINSDPYGAWIFRVKDVTAEEELLGAAEYEALTQEEE